MDNVPKHNSSIHSFCKKTPIFILFLYSLILFFVFGFSTFQFSPSFILLFSFSFTHIYEFRFYYVLCSHFICLPIPFILLQSFPCYVSYILARRLSTPLHTFTHSSYCKLNYKYSEFCRQRIPEAKLICCGSVRLDDRNVRFPSFTLHSQSAQ
jgi:hypothetical protein